MSEDLNLHTIHERTLPVASDALRPPHPDSDNDGMQIGKVIRTLRQEQGLTLEELALRIGSDAGNLSRVERGKQRYTPEMLQAIADALKTPVSSLFIRAEQKLAAYDVQGKPQEDAPRPSDEPDLSVLLRRAFTHLDPEKQKLVVEFARMLSRQSKTAKAGEED